MNDCTVLVHMHHVPWTVTASGLFPADTLYPTHITTHKYCQLCLHRDNLFVAIREVIESKFVVTSCPEQDYRLCASDEIRLHQRMDFQPQKILFYCLKNLMPDRLTSSAWLQHVFPSQMYSWNGNDRGQVSQHYAYFEMGVENTPVSWFECKPTNVHSLSYSLQCTECASNVHVCDRELSLSECV